MSQLTDDPERQPLLSAQQQSVENLQATGNIITTDTHDDSPPIDTDASNPGLEKKPSLLTILWYTIWVAVGIIALVFFIKGFYDACDINVSLLSPSLDTFVILGKFDFKKALKSALGGGLSGAAGDSVSFPKPYIILTNMSSTMSAMVLQVLTLMVCLALENTFILTDGES